MREECGLRRQFRVETAVDLKSALRACIEKDGPVVHGGFRFGVNRPYYGRVHNRAPHKRRQEHLRAILQHGSGLATEKELKCSYMAHNGDAAKWHFLPYITCAQATPMLKLKAYQDIPWLFESHGLL